jgi:hypothetical protein
MAPERAKESIMSDAGTLSLKNAPQQSSKRGAKRIWPGAAVGLNKVSLNLAILLVIAASLVGCSGGVAGTYTAPNGAMTLELKSGGDASVTFAGQTAPCKYTASGSTLTLTCPGQAGAMNFTIQKDGSLAGPPDSFFPPLVKK